MKQYIFVIAFFCVLIFAGCERERNYERTTWVNPDVECCGVKDPLNNLEWLNERYVNSFFYKEYNNPSYGFIYIFRNDSTLENFIVTRIYGTSTRHYFELFTCDGNIIDEGFYINYNNDYTNPDVGYDRENVSIIMCEECEEFFKNHTLIDTIYYFYTK